MYKFKVCNVLLIAILSFIIIAGCTLPEAAPTAVPEGSGAPDLGSAANYAVLAGSTITNAGLTVVNGNIGLYPGIAVSGFGPGICTGTIALYPDPIVVTAKLDLTTAYNDLVGRGRRSAPGNAYFFEDIGMDFSYKWFTDFWKTHYSRAIENQLDVVHLPFVHYDTIGRGNRTVVDGPVVEWLDENRFIFYVYNHTDNGEPARKPEEMPEPDPQRDFKLFFCFPNLWQNYIHEKARIVVAFVPVDEENSILYLRFYQKFVRIPLLRSRLTSLAMPFNRKILHQDRRVVETQEPKRTALKMGEMLIPGDKPIIEYRKRRQQLKGE